MERAIKERFKKKIKQQVEEAKKTKKQKTLRSRARFRNFLFNISISLFMWGMRIEKVKYPLYWAGPHFKQHKYSVWLLVLAGFLSVRMKYGGRAACVILDSGRRVSVAQCDLQISQELNYLYYQKVCEAGAKIYKQLAKEANQKSFKLKEINNAD